MVTFRRLAILSIVLVAVRYADTFEDEKKKIEVEVTDVSIELRFGGTLFFRHSLTQPAIIIGYGIEEYANDLGNFKISEKILKRSELKEFAFVGESNLLEENAKLSKSTKKNSVLIKFYDENHKDVNYVIIKFEFLHKTEQIRINLVEGTSETLSNRLYIKFPAKKDEKIYGGGEQYTFLNLKNRSFPMWGREQGVGRSNTVVSKLAELIAGAGGDYHTTYWPQATFVSNALYYMHLNYSYYNVLHFKSDFHELELWGDYATFHIYLKYENNWEDLIKSLTGYLGRQPRLPRWITDGVILGVQDGFKTVMERYKEIKNFGGKINAIWIQDWSGKLLTSLGKRVYWNWYLSEDFYTWHFKEHSDNLKKEGVRFLAYMNPHVINGSEMFKFGDEFGYFIQNKDGSSQLVDFGDFHSATVDLTNPNAYKWYQNVLRDMADAGFSGWMADFGGEYLPIDDENTKYYDKNMRSSSFHNYYNVLWAKMNREVVEENNELFVFMRSGYGESGGFAPSAWTGDQNVDFTKGDGLASVIPATLSLGMSGMGITHSDIGGYVSLICMVRTEELLLRWAEMSVFSPVMRTHEGNRPDKNWQVYTTNETIRKFSRLTNMFSDLTPYHRQVFDENAIMGFPCQRPLFFHYSNDLASHDIQYQYLYGQDLLVAPVIEEGSHTRAVYLPPDDWVYLWDDEYNYSSTNGGTVIVPSVIGQPPVFYRRRTVWISLFKMIREKYKMNADKNEGLSWDLLTSSPWIFIYLVLRKIFYYFLLYF